MMPARREFLKAVAGAGMSLFAARTLSAMQTTQSFAGPMQQNAYLPVKLTAKAGVRPSMTDDQRDELEHQIKCQCGCPALDVYTCRTTDFSCGVSPGMHADIVGLVAGGYAAQEIISAFQAVYGERVLMSPLKEGFNLVGYLMPFAALITGGVVVAGLIRRWGSKERRPAPAAPPSDATPAELDALAAAVMDDR